MWGRKAFRETEFLGDQRTIWGVHICGVPYCFRTMDGDYSAMLGRVGAFSKYETPASPCGE